MKDLYTFQHSFPGGLTCTMLVQPAIYYERAGKSFRPAKKWNRKPTDKEFETFFPEYIKWVHTVNAELAEIIGEDHVYVIQDSYAEKPFWEFWVYHANGEKECVAKGDGPFDPALIGRAGVRC